MFYSIRSERLLMEELDYNLLFRWFVGLSMDDEVWDHSTFSKNRDRLLDADIIRKFFLQIRQQAEAEGLLSNEHFTVDGTLIEAWASQKSFQPKDGGPSAPTGGGEGRNEDVDYRGQKRSNETHASTTDPDARLSKKSQGGEARLSYMGHVLMENRNGLVVAAEATSAANVAEREAAVAMLDRTVAPKDKRKPEQQVTLGADTLYQDEKFIQDLRDRGVAPHVRGKAMNTNDHPHGGGDP